MRFLKAALPASLVWRCAGLLSAAAAAMLAWTMPDGADLPPPAAGMAEPEATQPRNGAAAARAAYPGIDTHPLFYASRQPWMAAAAANPRGLTLAESYELTGIVQSPDGRAALLRPAGGGKTVTLTEGQALDGWTLLTIGAGGLHFEKDKAPVDLTFPALQPGQKSGRAPN